MLDNLAVSTNNVVDRQDMLKQEVQNLNCLTEIMNKRITPLVSQATAIVTQFNEIADVLAFHQMQVDELKTIAMASRDIGGQNSSIMDTLEESFCLLWAR